MSTISARIVNAVTEMEHNHWRTRCNNCSGLLESEYLDSKCVFLIPGLGNYENGGILSSLSNPQLMEELEDEKLPTWSHYELKNVEVIEVSMMCAVICYRLSAKKIVEKGEKKGSVIEYEALCSSSYKQLASSRWKMCTHHESPIQVGEMR